MCQETWAPFTNCKKPGPVSHVHRPSELGSRLKPQGVDCPRGETETQAAWAVRAGGDTTRSSGLWAWPAHPLAMRAKCRPTGAVKRLPPPSPSFLSQAPGSPEHVPGLPSCPQLTLGTHTGRRESARGGSWRPRRASGLS